VPLIHKIKIPKLGMAVAEAMILEWCVGDGEMVEAGSPLYVAGTDKVDQEVPSPVSGRLRRIGEENQTYPVGSVVAEIVAD